MINSNNCLTAPADKAEAEFAGMIDDNRVRSGLSPLVLERDLEKQSFGVQTAYYIGRNIVYDSKRPLPF